jgi:hypothetical protein
MSKCATRIRRTARRYRRFAGTDNGGEGRRVRSRKAAAAPHESVGDGGVDLNGGKDVAGEGGSEGRGGRERRRRRRERRSQEKGGRLPWGIVRLLT